MAWMLPFRTLVGPLAEALTMTTDHIELIWDRDCACTAQTASGSRLDIGGEGQWTAEQLLMAAAESAIMTSFVALAEAHGLDVLGYVSSAAVETTAGPPASLRIVVRPCVAVADPGDVARAEALLERVREHSAVARSLEGTVHLDPQVVAIGSP